MSTLLLFLFFLISPVLAEDLDSIEVNADKNANEFSLGSFESLSTLELENSHSGLVADAIDNLNGLTPSQNGGPGGRVTFFIRGTESRHVSFTIDSLRINDTSNTDRQFDSAFLSSSFLQQVTLYKGPQAVLFGSDAMGGLIDMKTRKGEHAPETRLSFNGGSFGTLDSSLSQDWKAKNHQGTFTWTSFRTDGLSRLNKKRFNATERDGADMTQLTSSSQHAWSANLHTELLISFLRGNNELDGGTDDNDNDEGRSDQYMLQQKTSHEVDAHSAISLRNGISRHQRSIKSTVVGAETFEGDLIQNEFLYDFDKGPLHLLTGLATEQETFAQKELGRVANLHSLFLQSQFKKNHFTLQSGLRLENHSRYGAFQTGAMGVGYEFKREKISLQYSQGFKAPSLYQLHGRPVFGLPVGNSKLVPERNHAYEIKWLHENDEFKSEVALYQNRMANLITFTNQGFQNQGRFIAQGVEASAEWSFEDFKLRPSLMIQDFKEEEKPILRRPLKQYNLEVAWFPAEEWELFSKYKFHGSRSDLDENGARVKLNEFETVDLGTRLVQGNTDYGIQILNLFNRTYEELYGYSVLPLSVFIHWGHRFK